MFVKLFFIKSNYLYIFKFLHFLFFYVFFPIHELDQSFVNFCVKKDHNIYKYSIISKYFFNYL